MGFSNNLGGAGLTVAIPLGLLAAVVLWGFFGRRPASSFGGISKGASEPIGRPELQTGDPDSQVVPSGVQTTLRDGGQTVHGGDSAAEVGPS